MTTPGTTETEEPRLIQLMIGIERRLEAIEHELASMRRESGGASNRLEQQLGFKLPPEV